MSASAAETIRVLLVEDDPDDYLLTRDLLSGSSDPRVELEWSPTYAKGLEAISRAEHDVYLLDYLLGERTGLDLLRDAMGAGCRAPIILLTGTGGREVDMAAMRLGAADYLVKGKFDAVQLERTIRYSVDRNQIMEQLRLFRTAVEQTADGIVITTADGRWPASSVVYANPAFTQLSAFASDELEAISLEPLLGFGDEAESLERIRGSLASGDPAAGQIVLRRKDGSGVVASCHVGPITDEDGTVTHMLALFEDSRSASGSRTSFARPRRWRRSGGSRAAGRGRRRTNQAGDSQPGRERPRRDADRWSPQARDGDRASGRHGCR